jgi:ABC-type nitrate/sulfonate/bicarbonate transport system substrate-binding protein
VLPVAQAAKAPVVLLGLQPTPTLDYANTDTGEWLANCAACCVPEIAGAFTRAYAKARSWVQETSAGDVARLEASHFPGIDQEALTAAITAYQRLGTWRRPLEIPRDAYEVTLDVFEHSRLITRRHAYDAVVARPPLPEPGW